jgi:N-terminal domain of anti-restriction factor ArdC
MATGTKEQYREHMAAKVAAAQEVLAAEVGALVSGDDWRQFLDFQAQLHDYSANNVMLIFAQHGRAYEEGRVSEPTPTFIAGFETWRALGRSVERGQHGYAILAPMRGTRREARDPEGNVRTLSRGDRPNAGETETKTPVLRGFTVATVFDASQTSGKALPYAPRPHLLEGEAPRGLGAAVKELIESNGFAVDTVVGAEHLQGANGRTDLAARTVLVRADMDDAAMVKTLIHEAAHVLLHQNPPGREVPRPLKEVEAESVAYVVASVHGMPTDDYSFPYVAGWAGEDPDKAIRETQARVNVAARAIIAESPAEHTVGSKPPGTDLAVAVSRKLEGEAATRKSEMAAQMADNGAVVTSTGYGGPEVA